MIAPFALAAAAGQPAVTPAFIRTAAPADLATRILGLAGANTIDARVVDQSAARDDAFLLEFAGPPRVLDRDICASPVRRTNLQRTNWERWDDPPVYRVGPVTTAMRYAPMRSSAVEDCARRTRVFASVPGRSLFFDLSVRHGSNAPTIKVPHVRFAIAAVEKAAGAADSIRCRDVRGGRPDADGCRRVVVQFASLSAGDFDRITLAPCRAAPTRWCVSADRFFDGNVANGIAAAIEMSTDAPVSPSGAMPAPGAVRTDIALITPPSHWP